MKRPTYTLGEYVSFTCENKTLYGKIYIVDYFGTFGQSEEPSYDIMSIREGSACLYKHIRESLVIEKITETVLCYIERYDSYLMLLRNKREVDMNKNKWIGIGGHIEENETMDMAIDREVLEETGLKLEDKTYHGDIYFITEDYTEVMHLYSSDSFSGVETECNEGTLQWIHKKIILDLNIWEGDRIFLPLLLENKKDFSVYLYYENNKLVGSEII